MKINLGKNNKQIIVIASKIIDRFNDEITDCYIENDNIVFRLSNNSIVRVSKLYKDYYNIVSIYKDNGAIFERKELINYCPSVDIIYEILNILNIDSKQKE